MSENINNNGGMFMVGNQNGPNSQVQSQQSLPQHMRNSHNQSPIQGGSNPSPFNMFGNDTQIPDLNNLVNSQSPSPLPRVHTPPTTEMFKT